MSALPVAERAPVARPVAIARAAVDALTAVAIVGAVLATATFIYVAARRVGHPYELEWIEGGSLDEVARVLHGHALYTRPTIAWTPNIYPPIYYWVAAAVARVFGLHLATLRVVSLASTATLAVCVWNFVRRETGELVGPLVATGFVFAAYRIGGSWFDVARVDMLFVALLFAGLFAARSATRPATAAAAAVLFVLALLAKQSALVPALAVVPWLWTRGRACALTFVGVFGAGCAAAFGALQVASHGWFSYYMWTVPSHHEIEHSAVVGFWTGDLARHLWPELVLVAIAFISTFRSPRRDALWFHVPVLGALVFASYSARLHTGGWDNVLLPAYVGIAVVAGIGIGSVRGLLDTRPALVAAVTALAIVQFGLLAYRPARLVPGSDSTAAGDAVVARLHTLPGPVLLTGQPWLLRVAGRDADLSAADAHASALQDVLRADAGEPSRTLANELEQAVRSHRYCSIVVDRPAVFSSLPADLDRFYQRTTVLVPAGALDPVTGYPIEPAEVWSPVGAPACGGA